MDYQNNGPRPERVWHQAGDADGCTGNWKCAKCGAAIDRLPFPPDPSRTEQLLCKDCHRQKVSGMRRF